MRNDDLLARTVALRKMDIAGPAKVIVAKTFVDDNEAGSAVLQEVAVKPIEVHRQREQGVGPEVCKVLHGNGTPVVRYVHCIPQAAGLCTQAAHNGAVFSAKSRVTAHDALSVRLASNGG